MARPTSVTKEKILAAAIDIVRKGGTSALTARSLSSALGCGVNAIFSKFGSMEGVLEAVRTEARRLFKERVGAGFSLNPPFKGMGLAFLWFAIDEPQLFKLVMDDKASATSFCRHQPVFRFAGKRRGNALLPTDACRHWAGAYLRGRRCCTQHPASVRNLWQKRAGIFDGHSCWQ